MSIVGGQDKPTENTSNDFFSIATLLGNPAKLKAEYDKLENAKREAERVVALVGPAREVMALREQAKVDANRAAAALAQANDNAQMTMRSTQERAAQLTAHAEQNARSVMESAHRALESAQSKLREVSAKADEVERAERESQARIAAMTRDLEERMKAASEALKKAVEQERQYRELRAKLESVESIVKDTLRRV